MKEKGLVGYYNYTVILTYISVACAAIGTALAANGHIHAAVILLLVCGLCDAFDGSIAGLRKRTPQEMSFGAHIDSLSDLIAFGVLPASILYGLGLRGWLCYVAMIIYVLAALIRLAYFDVQEAFADRAEGEKREDFKGLPVTNAAVIFPSILTINLIPRLDAKILYLVFLIITAVLFVVPIRVKKLYLPALLIPIAIVFAVAIIFIIFGGVYDA